MHLEMGVDTSSGYPVIIDDMGGGVYGFFRSDTSLYATLNTVIANDESWDVIFEYCNSDNPDSIC